MKLKALILALALLPGTILAGSIQGAWELVKVVAPDNSVETPEDMGFGLRWDITDSTITPNILDPGGEGHTGKASPYTLEDGVIMVTWGENKAPLCEVASQEGDSMVVYVEEDSVMLPRGHSHFKRVSD